MRESAQEQALYDTLGPRTRYVLRNGPRELNVKKLLSAFLTTGRRRDADGCPLPPDLLGVDDDLFASFIERAAIHKPVEDTMLKRRRG